MTMRIADYRQAPSALYGWEIVPEKMSTPYLVSNTVALAAGAGMGYMMHQDKQPLWMSLLGGVATAYFVGSINGWLMANVGLRRKITE
jgi:hypothetical protein